jgi:predicted Zn-dependent peptidase
VNPNAVIPALITCLAAHGASSVQEFRLPNGLRVLLSENHERPLVRLELRTLWDPAEEPRGKEGVGGFLGEMLKVSGVGPYKQPAFQRFLEDRALRFSFAAQSGNFAWSVLSDSQGQDAAFESLSMAVSQPVLEETQIEAQRQRFIQSLKARTRLRQAEDRFERSMGSPAGMMLPLESSIGRIEASDLRILLRRVLRPEKTVLVIQGDVNLAQAKQLTMLHLGAWGPGSQDPVPPVREKLPDQPPSTRTWIARGTGTPVEIKVGARVVLGPPTPSFVFEFSGRLLKRELALEAPGALAKMEFETFSNGTWMLSATATPGKSVPEAMQAVQALLVRWQGKSTGDRDLSQAREGWRKDKAIRALHPQLEAASLAERALAGGDLDERVDRLTADDIQSLFRRMFTPEGVFYFVTGAAPGDPAQLEKAGQGPVDIVN